MSEKQRRVAGLWCGEVLERLSAYLDGELDAASRAQVEAHVAGCDWCERFGQSFAETIRRLRIELGAAAPLEPDRADRLQRRLREHTSPSGR